MPSYLDEYFSRFTPLKQPECGGHALHFDGVKIQHKEAVIQEFKERLAGYYPAYTITCTESDLGPGRVYIEAKMVLILKNNSSLKDLI